jgi:hypothetical protein
MTIKLKIPDHAWWTDWRKFTYMHYIFHDDTVTWVIYLQPSMTKWLEQNKIDYSMFINVRRAASWDTINGRVRWWKCEGLNVEIEFARVEDEVLFKLTWL